jgi:probable rRNA maturation factor
LKNLFVYSERNFKVDKRNIHKIVFLLTKELLFSIESIYINLVSSDEIKEINNKYLEHNFSTDIITFNYSGENDTLDGEIFISLDDACKNAKKYVVSLDKEILRLVIHGFLHLLGYDDTSPKDKKIMKAEEDRLVNMYCKRLLNFVKNYDC